MAGLFLGSNMQHIPKRPPSAMHGKGFAIYTDGSYSSKYDAGAWAFVAVHGEDVLAERSCFATETTNNRMELQAIVEAVTWANRRKENFVLYTDSQYALVALQMEPNRVRVNADLVKQLRDAVEHSQVKLTWVKGHSIHRWNNYVDRLAVETRKRMEILLA